MALYKDRFIQFSSLHLPISETSVSWTYVYNALCLKFIEDDGAIVIYVPLSAERQSVYDYLINYKIHNNFKCLDYKHRISFNIIVNIYVDRSFISFYVNVVEKF